MKKINFLTKGTLHSSQVFQYKTRDGRAVFAFSYEQEIGHFEIFIHAYPSYNGRDEARSIAHWNPCDESPTGRRMCFTTGKEPDTLEKAKKYSMQYAELTWTYILTGITIDEQILQRN